MKIIALFFTMTLASGCSPGIQNANEIIDAWRDCEAKYQTGCYVTIIPDAAANDLKELLETKHSVN